jgi:hypothetical protein
MTDKQWKVIREFVNWICVIFLLAMVFALLLSLARP